MSQESGPGRQLEALECEYVTFFLTRFPIIATYLGAAHLDSGLRPVEGRLRNYSSSAMREEDVGLSKFKERFSAIADVDLSSAQRIDKRVALAQINYLLHLHQVRRHQERSLDSFVEEPFYGVDWQVQSMTRTAAAAFGTDEEWRSLLSRLDAVPDYLDIAVQQLDVGVVAGNVPDWRMLRQSGLSTPLANAQYFEGELPRIAAGGLGGADHPLARDIERASRAAADSFRRFRGYVIERFFGDVQRPGASALKPPFRSDNFVLGSEEYNWALRNNFGIEDSAEKLYGESWRNVQCTREEMLFKASEIATSRGWRVPAGAESVRRVLERLSEDAPGTDVQMFAMYQHTGQRLSEYIMRTGLFFIPEGYSLLVTETPPSLREALDSAAYFPAPPFKRAAPGRFYVTPTGNNSQRLRQQHNRHAAADLAAHEGLPGHDLHYRTMALHAEQISPVRWLTPGGINDSSSMWIDSICTEGWALYAEGLLAEPRREAPSGFYSPEERLYQLRGLLLRDIRVCVDIGLHTGRLGFEEAVTLLSETLDFIPGSCAWADASSSPAKCASCTAASAEVTRYARWPTQAITYRIGRDHILALRRHAQAELGEKYSDREFHSEFMKQGPIPISYFADELMAILRRQS